MPWRSIPTLVSLCAPWHGPASVKSNGYPWSGYELLTLHVYPLLLSWWMPDHTLQQQLSVGVMWYPTQLAALIWFDMQPHFLSLQTFCKQRLSTNFLLDCPISGDITQHNLHHFTYMGGAIKTVDTGLLLTSCLVWMISSLAIKVTSWGWWREWEQIHFPPVQM